MLEKIENEKLARGFDGTARTIERMHELVKAGKLDPTMHRIATWIRLQTGDKRSRSRELADAIFYWVKRHGLYQRDPFQIERIEHPIASMRPIIEAKQKGIYDGRALFVGDCDLFAIWVGALGGILGYQYAFETVKLDPARPEEFSHIYPVLQVEGKWVAYDASTSKATPNWRPSPEKSVTRWVEKNIEDVGMSESNGDLFSQGMIGEELFRNYYSSSIPKHEEYGKPYLPKINMGVMDLLPPPQPMKKKADVAKRKGREAALLQPQPSLSPSERIPMDSKGFGYYPKYRDVIPGVHAEQTTPPGWPWVRQVRYVYGEGPEMLPATGAAGMGQAAIGPLVSISLPVEEERRMEEISVFGTIGRVIDDIARKAPEITDAIVDRTKAKYQERVERARAEVELSKSRQSEIDSYAAAGVPREKSWYQDPIVWVAGAAAVGLGAFLLTKKTGTRKRRRRR